MAHNLVTPGVWDDWPFHRMPLYPLLLRVSFELFGTNALSALLPGTVLGFAGVWILSSAIRKAFGEPAAVSTIVVLGLHPLLVAYEHAVLTESGTFFFLALIAALALAGVGRGLSPRLSCALGVALAAGYLYRGTLLALLPVVAIGVALRWRAESGSRLTRARPLLAAGLAIAIPIASAAAWSAFERRTATYQGFDVSMLYYWLHQGVVSPDHGVVDGVEDAYREARDRRPDPFSLAPMPDRVVMSAITQSTRTPVSYLEMAADDPVRYALGVFQSISVFVGMPSHGDNVLVFSNVMSLTNADSKCLCAEPVGSFDAYFKRPGSPTVLHYAMLRLERVYRVFVVAGWMATVLLLVHSVRIGNAAMAVLAAVPTTFAVAHAVLLLGLDRFAVPTHVFVVANLFVSFWSIRQRRAASEVLAELHPA